MSIKAPFTKSEEFEREVIPAGSHLARVYQIVHIGKVEEEYMGEVKFMDKVRIGFELPNELRTFGDRGELPLVLSQEYTLSLGEKANLRRLVEGMIGATLDDTEEFYGIESLMGRVCLLNVIQKTSKKGKVYAQIVSASPLPKGMSESPAINEPFLLDYEENWSEEKYNKLPDFIKDKMKNSEQFKRAHNLVEKPTPKTPDEKEADEFLASEELTSAEKELGGKTPF